MKMTPIRRMPLLNKLLTNKILELILKHVNRLINLIAQIQKVEITLMEQYIQVRRGILIINLLKMLAKLFMRSAGLGLAEFQVVHVYEDVLFRQLVDELAGQIIQVFVVARDFEVGYAQ